MTLPPALTAGEAGTHHRTATVLWGALFLGPAIFAVVVRGLVENENAIATGAPLDPVLARVIWGVMAAAALWGAMVFRGRAAGLAESPDAARERNAVEQEDAPSPASVIANLVVSWVLAEGQIVLAMALYFMTGDVLLWWCAVAVHLVALVASYPRRRWFTGLVATA